jgi:multidrug efflux pump subunit AcrA (membrane-fusion protein)
MKKKMLISIALVAIAGIASYYFYFSDEVVNHVTVKPTFGDFEVVVNTTGELRAKNSTDILGPSEAQKIGIYNMKITNLIDEGTHVKAGEFVAELDKSEITNKIKEIELNIQKYESQYKQKSLDSSLNLSQARDNLENMKYSLEEKKLQLEQSKYEPPATIRQAEIAYDKELRSYNQSKKNYSTKVEQAKTELSIVGTDLAKERQKLALLVELQQQFTILAPSDGMVIYAKEWGGRRRVVGSSISPWNPVVANLPDLSIMESLTYVNELDIQKVKIGQKVEIALDADSDKKLTGEVTKVANIGEDMEDRDSKVFEVVIKINEKDTTLLPSMTTSNRILIEKIKNVLSIPLDALHSELKDDNKIQYVFLKKGGTVVRQQVKTGKMNDDMIVIEDGLNKEDEILLTAPEDSKDMKMIFLEDRSAKSKIENKE